MATRQQRQIVETPTEARQAEPGPSVFALLVVSTGLAVLILGGSGSRSSAPETENAVCDAESVASPGKRRWPAIEQCSTGKCFFEDLTPIQTKRPVLVGGGGGMRETLECRAEIGIDGFRRFCRIPQVAVIGEVSSPIEA